jgi:hypothetical protein
LGFVRLIDDDGLDATSPRVVLKPGEECGVEEVSFEDDRCVREKVVFHNGGNAGFQLRANTESAAEDFFRLKRLRRRMIRPKVKGRVLSGRRHLLQQDLEVVDLGVPTAKCWAIR